MPFWQKRKIGGDLFYKVVSIHHWIGSDGIGTFKHGLNTNNTGAPFPWGVKINTMNKDKTAFVFVV